MSVGRQDFSGVLSHWSLRAIIFMIEEVRDAQLVLNAHGAKALLCRVPVNGRFWITIVSAGPHNVDW